MIIILSRSQYNNMFLVKLKNIGFCFVWGPPIRHRRSQRAHATHILYYENIFY